jgi:hypothetical protein
MKKLFGLVFFIILVSASVSADTATIISQFRVKATSPFFSDKDIIEEELVKLYRKYTFTMLFGDEWNEIPWTKYIERLVMNNRSWYVNDFNVVYRTNLVSNTGRKYVAFSYIIRGHYYTDTGEASDYDYKCFVIEIKER